MMETTQAMRIRDAAIGKIPCDLLIEHANILDVFSRRFYTGDVAILDGYIVALGRREAKASIDASGLYLTPGLVDAHIHIESTLVAPDTLNDVLLPHGVTDIIADPHEIANVSGTAGIDYIVRSAQQLDLGIHVMLPSCVPSTPLEHAGAVLNAEDLSPYYGQAGVLGLAEVMNAPGVASDPDMLQKLLDAQSCHAPIDGHGSTLDDLGMDLYASLGIRTDHECIDVQGLQERVKHGMYVHVRQGTVTKNLKALLPGVTRDNAHRICFCTDDKHLDELMAEGGLDAVVRLAISEGMDPALALSCATLNPCSCYKLEEKGAVAPGYLADLVLWDASFHAQKTFLRGRLAAEGGTVLHPRFHSVALPEELTHSVNPAPVTRESLALSLKGKDRLNVIGVLPGNVLTDHLVMDAPEGDFFLPDASRDLAKLCVIERHHQTGLQSVCAVTGFALKRGAIATTVAHDSHNIIVIGMDDSDILAAVDALVEMQGGYVVVEDAQVKACVPLEVSGLMSARDPKAMLEDLAALHQAAHTILGQRDFNPFQMLSFISLPVIPSLKLTDAGLIDVLRFCAIDPAFSSKGGK